MRLSSAAALLALSTVACNSDIGGPPTSYVLTSLVPYDLATGELRSATLRLHFDGTTSELPAAERDAIVASARVVSLPDLVPIALDPSAVELDAQTVELRFAPQSPLPDGWFAFEVSLRHDGPQGPAGSLWQVAAPIVGDDGVRTTHRARFHAGSFPLLLASAEPDPAGSDGLLVSIEASEPLVVRAPAGVASIVTVLSNEAVVPCTLPAGEAMTALDLHDGGPARFLCAGVRRDALLHIRVAPGLASASGVPLHDMTGASDPAEVRWMPSESYESPREPAASLFTTAP